jgi:hypothetical protein
MELQRQLARLVLSLVHGVGLVFPPRRPSLIYCLVFPVIITSKTFNEKYIWEAHLARFRWCLDGQR